jgi:hypothetical protein
MPKNVQSKSSAEIRKAQNKGVKHGTVRTGRGGRSLRRYNANTGRWNIVATTGRTKGVMGAKTSQVKSASTKIAGSGTDAVNASSSAGSARTSSLAKNARDSLMSMPRTKNPLAAINRKTRTRKTVNRPRDFGMGTAVRLKKSGGQLKYVKVGKRRG